jgi:hypothetical protein
LRRCVALVALAVASSAGAASPVAYAATKKSPCVRAHVGGKSVCLRLGARCDPAQRSAYLGETPLEELFDALPTWQSASSVQSAPRGACRQQRGVHSQLQAVLFALRYGVIGDR